MSKNKKGDKRVSSWLSARADCTEGRFIQVGNSFLLSGTVQKLTPSTRWVYLCMAMESGKTPHFSLSKKEAEKYGIPHSTLDRARKELRDAGFVRIRSGKNTREKNQCEFDYGWKAEKVCPPNLNFGSLNIRQTDGKASLDMRQGGKEMGTGCPQSGATSEK